MGTSSSRSYGMGSLQPRPLLCVVCIELSDFVFAVDSIPAVLAITKDPHVRPIFCDRCFAVLAPALVTRHFI